MGNNENFESIKSADKVQDTKSSNLTSYMMERPSSVHSGRDKNDGLVDKGILPSFDIMEFKTGPEAKPTELKDSGVKVEHDKEGNTKVDYPSGVHVESGGTHHSEKNGHKIETDTMIVVAEPPNHQTKDGKILDPKNRVIAQENEDGSWTIDSGKGFYTQHADGTIERTSAIRSRDGKTFEVLDTENPLGNLKPGDMTKHK